MKLTYWGVRGSVPAPGPGTLRYGGNTPCLSLEHAGQRLILDAGSGIRGLGRTLLARGDRGGSADLLLSHVHWDHIQGIPFFAPLYSERWTVTVYGPAPEEDSLDGALRRQMSPPYFPLHFASTAARLRVTEVTAESLRIGPFEVRPVSLRHPGRTLGYRITPADGGASVSYLTDNELGVPEDWGPLVGFLRGTDLLVHDAMFTEEEAAARRGWGHSSVDRVVDLALAADVKKVVLFHHDPSRADDEMDRLLAAARHRATRGRAALVVDAAMEERSETL